MASTINADDGVISGSAGVKTTADTTGTLDIQTNGVTAISISPTQVVTFPSTTSIGTLYFGAGTVTAPSISVTGDTNTGIYFPAADTIAFAEGGVEAMRLDASGNLLVGGTTANSIVQVTKNVNNSTDGVTLSNNNEGEGYGSSISFRGAFGAPSATEQLVARITGFVTGPTTTKGGGIAFATGTGGSVSERARIDSIGNIGVNVTPSAWGAAFKVLQSGASAHSTSIGFQTNDTVCNIFANAYYDGSNYRYVNSSQGASQYRVGQNGGTVGSGYQWNIAPSGTAGNVITFSQAMLIDSSGNLQVNIGNIYTAATSGIFFSGSIGSFTNGIYGVGTNNVAISAGGSERARILSGGEFLIGSSSTGGTKLGIADGASDPTSYGSVQVVKLLDHDNKWHYACIQSGNDVAGIGYTDNTSSEFVVGRGTTTASTNAIKFNGADGTTRFFNNGSERARISSSGIITTSFQPAFLAKAVTINKIPWSELTGYASQLITSNRSSGFNLTTGRFTAPVAGVYTFSAIARGTDNSGQDAVPGFQLWKNGSMYENIDMWGAYAASYAGTIRPSFTFSVTIELAAGDYVSIAYTSTATNYVWFSGFLNG